MLNQIILHGRLTENPELKTTNSGKYVASFTLAVERDFSTENEKETDFINVVTWGKTAEFVAKYFIKGKQMLVNGRLQVRKWQNQNGENRYSTEVLAEKVYFAGGKEKDPLNEFKETLDVSTDDTSDFVEIKDSDDLPF